jgi:peptidoglycan/LPS O-acetylase OafA/YrhL
MEGRQANNFDFIRFVAASFVLITHSYTVLSIPPEGDFLFILSGGKTTLSEFGVRVFFVLSGYLIYRSYLSSRTTLDYIYKRSLRIFPALFVVIFLCSFLLGPLVSMYGPAEYFRHPEEILNYFYGVFVYPITYKLPGVFVTHPNPEVNISLWTIPHEFTCYLVLPLLLSFFSIFKINNRNALVFFLVTFSIIGSVFYILGLKNFGIPFLRISFIKFVHFSLFFFLGALMHELKFLVKKNINPYFIIGLIIVFLISLNIPKLNLISEFVFLPIILLNLSFIKGRLNNFGKYGDFSYGIYLYGFVVQQMVVYFAITTTSPLLLFCIAYPVTLVFGFLSWHLIEKKALRFKNLLKPKIID